MIKLYDYELSSDCYKVRLMLGLLEIPWQRVELDMFPGCEHQSVAFRAINPFGELPVIDADGVILQDAHAILIFLVQAYAESGPWYPREPAALAGRVAMWLAFAGRLSQSAGAARLHDTLCYPADIERCRADAHTCLRILDEHLWFAEQAGQPWICTSEHPTLADIACFPDVMLCEEGGISRLPYAAVRRWTDRLKQLPRFSPMSGIFGKLPSQEIST